METLTQLAHWLVTFVQQFGYGGLFITSFLEATVVPIPSELTVIPAGYLVHQGEMNFWLVMLATTGGTIVGSLMNYYIALHVGRRFLTAYGKYFLIDQRKIDLMERFFHKHGEISMLTGRLVPGLRHVVSFPAGLGRMDLKKFTIYTGVGGAVWMFTLVCVGYFIGGNKELVHEYMPVITVAVVMTVLTMITLYVIRHRRKTKKQGASNGMA